MLVTGALFLIFLIVSWRCYCIVKRNQKSSDKDEEDFDDPNDIPSRSKTPIEDSNQEADSRANEDHSDYSPGNQEYR